MTEPREAHEPYNAFEQVLLRYADRAHDNDTYRAMVPEVVLRDAAHLLYETRLAAAGVHLGDEGQDALRALSDAATPGPWIRKWQSLIVHHMGGDGALQSQEDIDFAVAAVNYVRAALAAQENPA